MRSSARALRSGANKLLGFGLSIVLLAAASLVLIPALITSGGDRAWGAIALGQAIGAIAAVAVYFGWGHTGPATIARQDSAGRRREYAESVATRLLLIVPVAALACALAALLSPTDPALAAVGALGAASIGLTSDWYFVGIRRPYGYLLLEAIPRVTGTLLGVVLLSAGAPPVAGLLSAMGGMIVAFGASSLWILRRPAVLEQRDEPRRSVRAVIASQRHGVASSIGTATYSALPLVIVSLVAPGIQPLYALVDKTQRQLSVALGPVVSVSQGYVPRAAAAETARRARTILLLAGVFCAGLALGVYFVSPWLLGWLGAGALMPSAGALALMAAFVGLNVWEAVLARAVLASFGQLRVVAWGTLVSAIVGFPLIAFGAVWFGVPGALGGLIAGLTARAVLEAAVAVRCIVSAKGDDGGTK